MPDSGTGSNNAIRRAGNRQEIFRRDGSGGLSAQADLSPTAAGGKDGTRGPAILQQKQGKGVLQLGLQGTAQGPAAEFGIPALFDEDLPGGGGNRKGKTLFRKP